MVARPWLPGASTFFFPMHFRLLFSPINHRPIPHQTIRSATTTGTLDGATKTRPDEDDDGTKPRAHVQPSALFHPLPLTYSGFLQTPSYVMP
jgi:hypothetical protein